MTVDHMLDVALMDGEVIAFNYFKSSLTLEVGVCKVPCQNSFAGCDGHDAHMNHILVLSSFFSFRILNIFPPNF